MNIPNTITAEQIAKQMGWSTTKTKAFIRKNDLPYHAQAGTYYLDANIDEQIWKILNSPLTKKKRFTGNAAQQAKYKAGISKRAATIRIKELEEKAKLKTITDDEKKELAELTKAQTPETESKSTGGKKSTQA